MSLRVIANRIIFALIQKEKRLPSCVRCIALLYSVLLLMRLRFQLNVHPVISRKLKLYVSKSEYNYELGLLKKGLDQTSTDLIDMYISRHLKGQFLYSAAEIRAWRAMSKVPVTYKFPADTTAIHDVFALHCGLRFLPKQCASHLRSGCVIDGGAAAGDSALMFLEYKPSRVYAFEPSPVQIAEMQEVFRLNHVEHLVEIVPFGLSDKREVITINDQRAEEFAVETCVIDDFAKNKKVSCIKLDVEGVEYHVVLGAKETIMRDRPILLISIYHAPEDLLKIKPLIESWGLGYKFLIRDTELCNNLAGVHLMLIAYCKSESFDFGAASS